MDEKIIEETESGVEKKTPEDTENDSLMEQIKGLRLEQKITPKELIPEVKKQKQNIITKNQKFLFLVFLICVIINAICFAVLLFF